MNKPTTPADNQNAPVPVGSGAWLGCGLSYAEYRACLEEADKRMKANNGHEYMHILKTRCQHCGASPKVKTRCRGWFETFLNNLGVVLQEKSIIVEKQPNAARERPATNDL